MMTKRWNPTVAALAMAVTSLGLVSCSSLVTDDTRIDDSERDAAGVITVGGRIGVNALQLGDCFDDNTTNQVSDVATVNAVACAEPHDNEVFYLGALPEADFPGDDTVSQLVSDQCVTVFDSFAGVTYEDSQLDVAFIYPSAASWADGDRGYICMVYLPEAKLEGSMRNTGL